MTKECVTHHRACDCREKLIKDVTSHQISILNDDGVNRRIRFQKPGTNILCFDLITWPGHLCYTGDMGTFVFKRLEDMFVFFRDEKADVREELCIDRDYWYEKCIAVDGVDGIDEYDPDVFVEAVNNYLNDSKASDALRKAVEDDVLWVKDDGEDVARRAVSDFTYEDKNGKFEFSDFHDRKLTSYTYRFIWCCYALAWGVKAYDKEISRFGSFANCIFMNTKR